MEFVTIEKGNYLSAPQMTDIYNDFLYIVQVLSDNGYSADTISIQDNSVSYDISPADILQKMKNVELNIQALHSIFDWYDEFYEEFLWNNYTTTRKKQVDRWIDWLNSAYAVISKQKERPQLLIDINGENITDITGNQILVLDGYIGE